MALPENTLSIEPVPAAWVERRKPPNNPCLDYEIGGIGLSDPSQGLQYQEWTLYLDGDDVVVRAPEVPPTVLFSHPQVRALTLAWDQNMRPFVAFMHGASDVPAEQTCTLWWWDTQADAQVFTDLPAGCHSPRATLDDKRRISLATSDILLAYIRDTNLCLRQQRDRYGTEYVLLPAAAKRIVDIGMARNYRVQVHLAPYEAGPAFSPLSIPWHTAFWAEDPDWLPPADGDPVSSWRNAGNGDFGDAVQATSANQPVYRANGDPELGGRPTIEGDAVSDWLATGAGVALAQPTTIVAVLKFNSGGAGDTSFVPFDGISASARHQAWSRSSSDSLALFAGATVTGGTQNSGGHLWIAEFDATDSLAEDGNTVISGDAGSHSLTGLTLFNDNGHVSAMGGHIAFLGVYDGLLTAQQKSDLIAWARSHYGTP